VAALDGDFGEFLILHLDIDVFADRVAFDLFLGRHLLFGDGIHHLAFQAVAGGTVQSVEPDLFGG